MLHLKAVALGSSVELITIGAGLLVSLPPDILWAGVVFLLSTGLVGGFVAGRFVSGGWRTAALHGGICGAIGGIGYALTLWTSMNYVVPRASYSAFWGINYFTATSGLLPLDIVTKYGDLLTVALAVVGAIVLTVEGVIAGGAAAEGSETTFHPVQ